MEKEQCSKHKIQAAGKCKRDTEELQCPVADSCCLLLHINLGRHNTVPPGVLKCSAQKKMPLMPVSLKQQQCTGSSPGTAGQLNVK